MNIPHEHRFKNPLNKRKKIVYLSHEMYKMEPTKLICNNFQQARNRKNLTRPLRNYR